MVTGETLRTVRKYLGESQKAFAERFGVDQATISRWEMNGVPTSGPAAILAKVVMEQIGIAA